jgi:hypothetical protein
VIFIHFKIIRHPVIAIVRQQFAVYDLHPGSGFQSRVQ